MADISKIKPLGSDTTYNIKDASAIQSINASSADGQIIVTPRVGNNYNVQIKGAIHYIVGPTTDTTDGTWTGVDDTITAYYDGLTIIYVPKVAGASTTTLNINNLGAKTCYYTNTNKLTTHFSVNTPIMLTYVGGYWKRADYNSNSDTQIRVYRQTKGYNNDYPLLVSRTIASSIGTAGTDGSYTGVYGVMWNDTTKIPTLNPSTGMLKVPGGITATLTGNADTASKVNNNLVIKLKSGTTEDTDLYTFNGSTDKTLDIKEGTGVSLSAAAGSATIGLATITKSDTTSTANPSHSGTFTAVDSVTYDNYGRVTGVNTKTVTLPSDNNTDTLVKQTAKTDNAEYKILTTSSASPTSGDAAEAGYDTAITINPSTNNLTADSYNNGIKIETVKAWSKVGPYDAGWKRVCTLSGYKGYGVGRVYINGNWHTEEPTGAIFDIGFSKSGYAHIKQVLGTRITTPDQVRLVYSESGVWYFDIHIRARAAATNPGNRYVTFIGRLTVTDKNETNDYLAEEPTTTTIVRDIISTKDQPSITVNLSSETAGLFTGADMTTGISGTLPVSHGGTGQTSIANIQAGKDGDGNTISSTYIKKAIGTTKGDILYWSAASTPERLAAGSDGQVLKLSGGVPVWSSDNNSLTGVKGDAESSYRTGNVNITPANVLGAGTTAQFWRGDNTWSNTLTGDFNVNGNTILSGETTADNLTAGNLQVNGSATFVNTINGNVATATALTSSAGGARNPIYFSDGKPVASAVTFGDLTANRLVWTTAANTPYAGYHYANNTKVAINSTSAPSENFFVNGTTRFAIGSSNTSDKKKVVIGSSGSRYLSFGAAGIQAYNASDAVSTFYLNYFGGSVDIGKSGTSVTTTIYGNTIFNGNTTHNGVDYFANGTTYYINNSGTANLNAATFAGVITASNTTDSEHSTAGTASVFVQGGLSVAKKVSAKEIRIDNNQSSKGVSLQYDNTLEVLNFVFS